MLTVLSARQPRWTNLEHTAIQLLVTFEENKDVYGEMPFAASPNDTEPHGVDLYNRAVAGEFGEIQEPTLEMIAALVMCQRGDMSAATTTKINELAATLDMLQDAVSLKMATDQQIKLLPAVQAELNALRLYRVGLAQLDTLPGYPTSFEWPTPPASPFVYEPPAPEEPPFQGVSEDELPKT
jgi:hypothetical protein